MPKDLILSKAQQETLDSFTKIDEHFYTLHYKSDYFLDKLLKTGCSCLKETAEFIADEMNLSSKYLDIKTGRFACTSFNAVTQDNENILARNFDFKDSPCLAVWCEPENGYKSIGMIDLNFMLYGYKHQIIDKSKTKTKLLMAPYVCTDGINEKGLAIAVLEIKSKPAKQTAKGKLPLTTTCMIRAVLDKCATVEEAITLFNRYNMNDVLFCNYHYHLLDKTGKSVLLEYVDNKLRILDKPEFENENTSSFFCANFFVSRDGDNEKGFGYDRYDIVKNTVINKNGIVSQREAMLALKECNLNYPKFCYRVTTLWSAVYNTSKVSMELCAGMNYKNQYTLEVSKPSMVQKTKFDC